MRGCHTGHTDKEKTVICGFVSRIIVPHYLYLNTICVNISGEHWAEILYHYNLLVRVSVSAGTRRLCLNYTLRGEANALKLSKAARKTVGLALKLFFLILPFQHIVP